MILIKILALIAGILSLWMTAMEVYDGETGKAVMGTVVVCCSVGILVVARWFI